MVYVPTHNLTLEKELKMRMIPFIAASATALLLVATDSTLASTGKDGGSSGAFSYSSNAHVAAVQRQAKAIVERYQAALNSSNFSKIQSLFAPNAVAEWNDKTTMNGVAAMEKPYEALFKTTKFNTDFQYDAVNIYGNVAIVRTHHPVGQAEINLKTGSKKLDFNREIFVLHRIGAKWKIILYTFSTQPQQGEQ